MGKTRLNISDIPRNHLGRRRIGLFFLKRKKTKLTKLKRSVRRREKPSDSKAN